MKNKDIVSIYKAVGGWCWHRTRDEEIISESHALYFTRADCEKIARELNQNVEWDIAPE